MTTVDPFASKVLDPKVHDRLVANLDAYAADAGIHPRFIWTSAKGTLTDEESAWAKAIRQHMASGQSLGLCYFGGESVLERMSLMAGWMTRNFIRARVSVVSQVLEGLQEGDGDLQTISCLLIPNFHVSNAEGGILNTRQVAQLYDLLTARASVGVQTVIRASSPKELASDYGPGLSRLVTDQFKKIHL